MTSKLPLMEALLEGVPVSFSAKMLMMRRSTRRTGKSEVVKAAEWIEKDVDPDGYEVETYPFKGRGVKTTIERFKGDFLLHYKGETISAAEGEQREGRNSTGYRFFYSDMKDNLCVDATEETNRLGRLVNHGRKKERNSIMKFVKGCGLVLFALRNIRAGEELLYDYGLRDLPWEKNKIQTNPKSSFNKGFEETNTKIAEDTSCHDSNTEEYSLDKCDNVLFDIDPGGVVVHTTSTPEGAIANQESSFDKGLEETNTKIAEDTSCHDPNTEEYSLDKCDNVLCDIDPCGDAVHTTSTPEVATANTERCFDKGLGENITKIVEETSCYDPCTEEYYLDECHNVLYDSDPGDDAVHTTSTPKVATANQESSFDKGFEETNTKIEEDTPFHDPKTEECSLDKCENVLCDSVPCGVAVHTTSTPGVATANTERCFDKGLEENITKIVEETSCHDPYTEEYYLEECHIVLYDSDPGGDAGHATSTPKVATVREERSCIKGFEETNTKIEEETPCHDSNTGEYSLDKCVDALCDSDPDGDAVHKTSTQEGATANKESSLDKSFEETITIIVKKAPCREPGTGEYTLEEYLNLSCDSDTGGDPTSTPEVATANKESSFKEGHEETITILVEETPCHDPGTEEYSLAKCDNALCDSDPGGDAVHTTSKEATVPLFKDIEVVDNSSSDESDCSEKLPFIRHFPMLKFADDHDCDKDPDYNPSDCNESSENDECNITYQDADIVQVRNPLSKKHLKRLQDCAITSSTATEKKEDKEVIVKQRSSELSIGQRDWGRKHFCFLCNASVCDIPRHLEAMHNDNELVQAALKKPKKSKERRALWKILINRGSYAHNNKAKEIGGELHVVRRPSKKVNSDDYVGCIHCFGYFKKKCMWRHAKNCSGSFANERDSSFQKSISHVSSVMTSSSACAKSAKFLLEGFFSKLKLKDEVNIVVKNDTLLNCFTISLLQEGKHHTDVSYTIRQLARLLMKVREMEKNDMHWLEVLNCKNWDIIAEAVRELSGFSYGDDGIDVEKPHICKKYGQALKGLIAALEGYYLSFDDDEGIKTAQKMMLKYEKEWKKIGKHSDAIARVRKEDDIDLLPLSSDVVNLKEYCVAKINKLCNEPVGRETYITLQKVLVTRLITFNARRGGEPGKLKVTQWPAIKEGQNVLEELKSLPIEEQLLAKRMKLGYVRGKGNKKVPILFPPETVTGIDLLLQHRDLYFSFKENKYVFGRINKMSKLYLRGCDCVREIGCQAKLKNTKYITATEMRKYLATMLQLLDMSEAELRWVTDHLGHSIDVHKKWYRMSNRAVEMTKVASVLVAAESGFLQKAHSVPFDRVSTANTETTHDDPGPTDDTEPVTDKAENLCAAEEICRDHRVDDPGNSCSDSPTADTEPLTGLIRKRSMLKSGVEDTSDSEVSLKRLKLQQKPSKKKQVHISWTAKEKELLFEAFSEYLEGKSGKLPGKAAIEEAQHKYEDLNTRSWLHIKFQLKNMRKKYWTK